MAEFLWTFAVQEVLKKVLKLVAEHIGLAWGLEKELSKLKQWLLKAEAILSDIDRKKLYHDSVRLWVEDLQHVVYEADDLLDELVYEDLRRRMETRRKMMKVCNSISFKSFNNNPIIFRHKMAKKMEGITKTLSKCYSEASPLGLVGLEFTKIENNELNQIRETISKLDENVEVIGRDNEVSIMVKKVIDSNNIQQVTSIIPIVGMGGIGKTTLAKMVFNHEVVRKHFDETIWVCVSEPFLINMILEAILQTLRGTSSGMDSKENLLRELQKEMRGKKYFLVLDDVWNENPSLWHELKYCLLNIGNRGNSIIVTTRSNEVARIMETLPRLHLERLSDDQCWSLFKKTSNANTNGLSITSKLEVIREELVKKFGGIPLIARVLGAALKFEGVYEGWLKTLESVIDIPLQDEDLVLSILKLSVDRLPSSSLKQCFAYCSNFPKDYKFEKKELIQMWIAQGFVQLQEGRSNIKMEDIGEKFFDILLSRSLFQDVVKDGKGGITHFKMHDLIHDIAGTIQNFLKEFYIDESRKSSRKLRTLICDRKMVHKTIHDMISNNAHLRVLVVNSSMKNLPNSIDKLKHLRYLDISNSEIEELPHSIILLCNLQILKLGSLIKELPKSLGLLVNLRHLTFSIPFTEKTKQMPPHLSQLTQLQTLSGFVVGFEKGCKIEELKPLKNLKGRLQLSNLEQVKSKEEARSAKLKEKENLCELFFEWSLHPERESSNNNYNDFEVLEGLQPHKNLQFLSIENFAGKLLPHCIFVDKLTVIHLRYCRRCEVLPMLGQLSNLEELKISSLHHVKSIGNEFYGRNGANHWALFPKLKKFILSQMHNLKHWEEVASNDNNVGTIFPHLQDLYVRGCPKLTSIPNLFGFPNEDGVKSLRTLHIHKCDKLATLPYGLQFCNSIEDLRIDGCSSLTLNLKNMHKLSVLFIDGLKALPQGLDQHLNNLKEMDIIGGIQDYDFNLLLNLPSLVKLRLTNYAEESAIKQLPPQLERLTSLRTLTIGDFGDIEALPEWLGNLTSLETLGLYYCRNLKHLPSNTAMLRLTKLIRLYVYGCPQLQLGQGLPEVN